MAQRLRYWDIAFFGLMIVGIIAAIFHFASGRPMNGVLATGASVMGLVIRIEMLRHPVATGMALRQAQAESGGESVRASGDVDDRSNWLTGGIVAGFVATTVMTVAMVGSYLLSGMFAQEEGNIIGEWFWGLTHNTLTDSAYDVPLGAYSINLVAGIFWAIVYTGLIEPRLSGPPWRRGIIFAVVPWILSLVVFFPIVGAGFLGLGLGAGPLPIIGNLILHLVYGGVLGAFYAIPESSVDREIEQVPILNRWENRGLAIGLAAGLVAGLTVGTAFDIIVQNALSTTEALTAGAAIGVIAGALIGPFIGLDVGTREEQASSLS